MTRFALATMTAAAAVILAPTLAAAQDASAPAATHTMVRYQNLNLNTEAGVRVLAHRLDGAVDYVCGGEPTSAAERGANADYRACRAATMSSVLKTIDAPRLSAMVEGRRLIQLAGR